VAPDATPAVLEAIANAELIVLGPGSLYTSVIPNLLIKGIAPAVMQSTALKIYVCNVMTQLGETTNYSAADHVEALLAHSGALKNSPDKLFQTVLVNNRMPDAEILPTPKGDVPTPVIYDVERVQALGVEAEPHPFLLVQILCITIQRLSPKRLLPGSIAKRTSEWNSVMISR